MHGDQHAETHDDRGDRGDRDVHDDHGDHHNVHVQCGSGDRDGFQ